jgi:GrpB-like predicted nucleotidyltransferase (UPF0157 family)
LWPERLAFRDALRASAALVAEYAARKRVLAARYRHDREAYTESKSSFIRRVHRLCGVRRVNRATRNPNDDADSRRGSVRF